MGRGVTHVTYTLRLSIGRKCFHRLSDLGHLFYKPKIMTSFIDSAILIKFRGRTKAFYSISFSQFN